MEKITLTTPEGLEKQVNLITIIASEKFQSSYLVYTEKEIADDKNELLIAKIKEENDEQILDNVTQEEHMEVIRLLNEVVKKCS